MAKINARGAHRVGPTFFTRKVRTFEGDPSPRVYFEAFRLRSDGTIQKRIMRTEPLPGEEGRTTKHSSAFTNLFKDNSVTPNDDSVARLKSWLERRGFEIVEESWR